MHQPCRLHTSSAYCKQHADEDGLSNNFRDAEKPGPCPSARDIPRQTVSLLPDSPATDAKLMPEDFLYAACLRQGGSVSTYLMLSKKHHRCFQNQSNATWNKAICSQAHYSVLKSGALHRFDNISQYSLPLPSSEERKDDGIG